MNTFSRIEKKYTNLKQIVDNRSAPNLLILQPDGNNLSNDPISHQRIVNKEHCDWILKQFENNPPIDFLLKTILYSNNLSYGIRAFSLSNSSKGENPLIVAVLIDEISTERTDLYKINDAYHITPRENEVIKKLQHGMTDKMIANELQLSPDTVRGYVKSLRTKLGVSTRTAILYKLFKN